MNPRNPYLSNSLAIRQEIQRFESVHPSIYALYDLIEAIPDMLIQQQIREHVVCIEGQPFMILFIFMLAWNCRCPKVLNFTGQTEQQHTDYTPTV